MSLQLSGDNGVTFNDSSLQGAAASPYGLKNKLINGDMRIAQRSTGSVTASTTSAFTYGSCDRWAYLVSQGSKFTYQQSSTAPAGFTNSLLVTSSSAYTVGASETFNIAQNIEGYNIADLDFGKSTAKTITLSFWVRSSLTGTFGGVLTNYNISRAYPFTYTISAANTWEQKTVTITGDTTGTWYTDNSSGLQVLFSLGTGSSLSGTAGSWSGSSYYGATGATSVVGTNGATFYITGVQLEIGSTATPFERRLYGTELALCQRYCTLFSVSAINTFFGSGFSYNSVNALAYTAFPVPMRVSPTVTYSNVSHFGVYDGSAGTIVTTALTAYSSSPNAIGTRATVASGLTAGQGTMLKDNGTTSATILCTSEL